MPGDCVLGIDCDKNTSASGGQCPPDPLDSMHSYFSGKLYPALHPGLFQCLCILLEWGGGGGGGEKSSVNFVMGSWHP